MIPLYDVLTQEQVQRIHDEAMKILGTIGIDFEYDPAVECFKEHGFRVNGHQVFFTEKQVMDALATCPKSFTLQARDPKKNLTCEDGSFILTPSYGPPFVYDGVTGERRVTTFEDYKNVIKLVQMSQNFQKQANNLWYEIFDIVKQNCTTSFESFPQDDMMERLLRARK